MHLSSALVAATTLFTSNAFLITPDIADAVETARDSWKSLIFDRAHSLDVACHHCPYFVEEKVSPDGISARIAVNNLENTVHLDITTNENGLQVNNETVYPLEAVNQHFPQVHAHQHRLDNQEAGIEVPIDFAVEVRAAIQSSPRFHKHRFSTPEVEEHHELLTIDFTVIGLGGTPVQAQAAHIDLLHDFTTGEYTVVRVQPGHFAPETESDVCAGASDHSLCRFRAMVQDRFRQMMAEAKGRTNAMKEWMKSHKPEFKEEKKPCKGMMGAWRGRHGEDSARPRGGRDGHHGHRHGRHHHGSPLVRAFMITIKSIVIPALLGVAFGLAASALGMMVGQLVVFCWMTFGRGGRRGAVENVRVMEVEIMDGEKEGLLLVGEEPPRYEDVDVEVGPDAKVEKE